MSNSHTPIFVHDDPLDLLSLERFRLLTRFPTDAQRREYEVNWMRRAVVLERRSELENLSTGVSEFLESIGWASFVQHPSSYTHVNRSIVREFYACLAATRNNVHPVTNEVEYVKIRGARVNLSSDWINYNYFIPEYNNWADFFNRPSELQERPSVQQLAYVFGETHLWGPPDREFNPMLVRLPHAEWSPEFTNFLIRFLANRVYGTINHTLPTYDLYVLAYATITATVNVGRYIVSRIRQIAWGNAGDGYIFFPYLITAMALSAGVREFDGDDCFYGDVDILDYE